MNTLKMLGLKDNWLYEVVVSSYKGQIPHAAPFGMKIRNFNKIIIEMYKGSSTLKNVLAEKEFALNAVDDPTIFYNTLYRKEKINFGIAELINAPVLLHSPLSIEARLETTTEKENSYLFEADIVHINTRRDSKFANRAKALVLESLILSTRTGLIPQKELEKALKENYRIIKKVAPGSEYEIVMHDLLTDKLGLEEK